MTGDTLLHVILRPALSLLDPRMDSRDAERMLMAIAMQESALRYRRQIRGPARGFWQFETAGVAGVRTHRATRDWYGHLLRALGYRETLPTADVQAILEHNDLLAAGIARLLLWTLTAPLPLGDEEGAAWRQYLESWRPGRPRILQWPDSWAFARATLGEG